MANTARAKKVSFADFVEGYKAGCEAGESAVVIAATRFATEMNEPSMTSRASGIRQEAAELGKAFPSPAGGGVSAEAKKKAKIDLLTSLLDDLDDSDDSDDSVE